MDEDTQSSADKRICQATIKEVVLDSIAQISRDRNKTNGADPTPLIWRVYHNERPLYHASIEVLCELRGEDPAEMKALFDRKVSEVYAEYCEFSDLPDITSNSPYPPPSRSSGDDRNY